MKLYSYCGPLGFFRTEFDNASMCGEGTELRDGKCIGLPVSAEGFCGENTVYQEPLGKCISTVEIPSENASMCGEGTALRDGLCVPDTPEMTQPLPTPGVAEQICGSGYSAWEEASGRDCKTGCIAGNFGYDLLSEAKDRCSQTSSCDGIMKYVDDKYYLRVGDDPHINHPGVSYCRRL